VGRTWRDDLDGCGLCCENAVAAYRRSIVEECCAGAVVDAIWSHVGSMSLSAPTPRISALDIMFINIPIANGPPDPELLAEVAGRLAEHPVERCPTCASKLAAVTYSGGSLNRDQWESTRAGDYYCTGSCVSDDARSGYLYWWRRELQPPFAAAWHESRGVRTYVLVSAKCERCKGARSVPARLGPGEKGIMSPSLCPGCNGRGTRTDVGAIARRYGGDGDARKARFEVQHAG
jgi:hypothetical protein